MQQQHGSARFSARRISSHRANKSWQTIKAAEPSLTNLLGAVVRWPLIFRPSGSLQRGPQGEFLFGTFHTEGMQNKLFLFHFFLSVSAHLNKPANHQNPVHTCHMREHTCAALRRQRAVTFPHGSATQEPTPRHPPGPGHPSPHTHLQVCIWGEGPSARPVPPSSSSSLHPLPGTWVLARPRREGPRLGERPLAGRALRDGAASTSSAHACSLVLEK